MPTNMADQNCAHPFALPYSAALQHKLDLTHLFWDVFPTGRRSTADIPPLKGTVDGKSGTYRWE